MMYFQIKKCITFLMGYSMGRKVTLNTNDQIKASDLTGIYEEIAEVIGVAATFELYKNFKGLQVTFPKKIYSVEYIRRQLDVPNVDLKKLSGEFGYTERRLRQLKNRED